MKKTYIEPQITVIDIESEGIVAISWTEQKTNEMDAAPARRSSGWEEYEGRW